MKNLAVFASGNGSNFEAIIDGFERGEIKGNLKLLVTNKPDCYAVTRANRRGLKVLALNLKDFSDKKAYEEEILKVLIKEKIDLIALAGYMLIITDVLLNHFENRIINIHPSLLPSFKGANGIKDAFDYGVKVFGVTIHTIDKNMDEGKIISQKSFEYYGTSLEEVEEQIHKIEHEQYVSTLKKLMEDEK